MTAGLAPPPSPADEGTWGGFLQKVWRGTQRKAALAEGDGGAGGYTVPRRLANDLLRDVAERGLVRRWATVVPMDSNTVRLPLPDAQTAVTAGYPPYFGGMLPSWVSESTDRVESEPAFRQVTLTAWELSNKVVVSNQLLTDAPALDGFLRRLFASAVAWMEDQAFLVGDGVGKPLGMLQRSTAVTRSGSNAFAAADAQGMVEKLLPSSWYNSVWVVHPSVVVKLTALTNWQPNENPQPPTAPQAGDGELVAAGALHGRPVYVSDKVPALGTPGDVLLIDPTLYAVGDRGLEVAVSEHPNFTSMQSVFRVVARVGGVPWLSGAVTLADATKTANAYVSLTA